MQWSAHIPTRFHVPRRTLELTRGLFKFAYRSLTFYAMLSQTFLLLNNSSHVVVRTPINRFGLLRFRSPLLTESINLSFPLGTKMFQFPRSVLTGTRGSRITRVYALGFPIRRSTDQCSHQLPVAFRR